MYTDKHKRIIKEGDTIRHVNGEQELVHLIAYGELGVDVSNPAYLKNHDTHHEYMPLSAFDLTEWEVI